MICHTFVRQTELQSVPFTTRRKEFRSRFVLMRLMPEQRSKRTQIKGNRFPQCFFFLGAVLWGRGQKGWTPEGRRAGQGRLGSARSCSQTGSEVGTVGEGLQESRGEVDMLIGMSSGVCVLRWSHRGQGYEGRHTSCRNNIHLSGVRWSRCCICVVLNELDDEAPPSRRVSPTPTMKN